MTSEFTDRTGECENMDCINLDLNISIQLHIYIENSVSLKTLEFLNLIRTLFSTRLQITNIHWVAHKYASLPVTAYVRTYGNVARTGPELLLVDRKSVV
jgi:hypothetical protein